MESKKVKTKINQLLNSYSGNQTKRIEALSKDLHIKRRWIIYLANGKKKASFHLAEYIDRLIEQRIPPE